MTTSTSPITVIDAMSLAEAQTTIEKINRHAQSIGELLIALRDRKGWEALGYESWSAFLRSKELDFSRSHLYRLMHQVEVNKTVSPLETGIPEAHAREIPAHFTPEQVQETVTFAKQVAWLEGKQPEARHYADAVEFVRESTVDDGDPIRRQVYASGYSPIIQRMVTGELAPRQALALADAINGCEPVVRGDMLRLKVTELPLIREMNRLYKERKRRETYTEIVASGHIQPGLETEAVPLAKAKFKDLRNYLDVRYAINRAGGDATVMQVVTTLYPQDMPKSIRAFCLAMGVTETTLRDYLLDQ